MKLRFALAAVAAASAAASGATAASVNASANANANIVAPGQISAQRELEFGTIAKPATGSSTVKVASNAADAATPSVTGGAFVPTTGQAHAAQFHLVGANAQTYSITASSLTFNNATGNLSNIGTEAPVSTSGSTTVLPASGIDDVYVGGHFDISSTTAVQPYSGTISLTVNFN